MTRIHRYASPLGPVTLASDGRTLTGLWFDGQRHFGAGLSPDPEECSLPVFGEAVRWLDVYFGGGIPDFTPPLSLSGTPFQTAVWSALLTIPYGETVSYGELASMLKPRLRGAGLPGAGLSGAGARAVGGAVGRNPVSLIVPCHRVAGAGGAITGYAGGVGRKLRLLELEKGVLC